LANGPRRCVTVHYRHLDVHQHQVEMAGTKLIDSGLAVCRYLQLVRGMFQVGGDKRANVFRVVNQQDAATAGILWNWSAGWIDWLRANLRADFGC
jgi:hypothetical protein